MQYPNNYNLTYNKQTVVLEQSEFVFQAIPQLDTEDGDLFKANIYTCISTLREAQKADFM